jgi:ornithine cyclodeaminase/alanine dehydrogenase-like protein (mu-crystallin family)
MTSLRMIAGHAVRELLDDAACIALVEQAMIATSEGETVQPPRWMMALPTAPHAVLGLMPGLLPDAACFGAKVTAVYPENHMLGLPSHQSLILLYEKQHGAPVAVIDGAEVTAARTAAASAVATRALAHPDAGDLAILGYGTQAERHIAAIRQIRPVRRIRVWGRSTERTATFAVAQAEKTGLPVEAVSSAEAAVEGADIICTVSAARQPILDADWIAPGAHVNIVGSSSRDALEVSPAVIARSRVFVDYLPAAMALGSDINEAIALGLIAESDIAGEIGSVLTGLLAGRRTAEEITAYKSVGIPAQDLACANFLLDEANRLDLGASVEW